VARYANWRITRTDTVDLNHAAACPNRAVLTRRVPADKAVVVIADVVVRARVKNSAVLVVCAASKALCLL
jgi:hypothetical protein